MREISSYDFVKPALSGSSCFWSPTPPLSPMSQADPLKRVAGGLAITKELLLVVQGGSRGGAMEALLASLKGLVGQGAMKGEAILGTGQRGGAILNAGQRGSLASLRGLAGQGGVRGGAILEAGQRASLTSLKGLLSRQ